jgi:hypothetical protein
MNISHFTIPPEQSYVSTLKGFFRAIYTVMFVPEHDKYIIHPEAAIELRNSPQPLHRSVYGEKEAILSVLEVSVKTRAMRPLSSRELLGFSGVLMQFTLYLPELRPYFFTSYKQVEQLYQACVATSAKYQKPLSFADQLEIALSQTDGDLYEALWRLLVCFRLYARWYDAGAIKGLPLFSRDEIILRMRTLAKAVAATKPHDAATDQDVLGDTYYCWTHALAKVVLAKPTTYQTLLSSILRLAIHHGTYLNHKIAHRITPQILKSDHTSAARYGNAIGKVSAVYMQSKY